MMLVRRTMHTHQQIQTPLPHRLSGQLSGHLFGHLFGQW
jgi:hypothetical protein